MSNLCCRLVAIGEPNLYFLYGSLIDPLHDSPSARLLNHRTEIMGRDAKFAGKKGYITMIGSMFTDKSLVADGYSLKGTALHVPVPKAGSGVASQ